jgi:hypothetical protein
MCNIPDIKSMQNRNKMIEMVDEQQYNQNNTTIIPKQYQNNTRKITLITESNVHLPLRGGNLQQSRALLQ